MKNSQLLAVIGLVALGVVVGIAGLLLAVLPQRSDAKKLDAQIAAAQEKLASLQRGPHRGPVIRAAQLFQLARAMPQSVDMPGLIVDLSRAAEDSKVSLVSVGPGQPVLQTDGASGIPLKVSISGSWGGIAAFLHVLRSNVRVNGGSLFVDGRLFTVDTVQLSPGGNASGTTTGPTAELTASLAVNAFSYGVPPPSTTTTSTGGTTTTTTTTPSSASVSAAASTG